VNLPLKQKESDERLPRYHRLQEVLRTEIAEGRWLPEETIPPESELARTHAVSVGTIRKAIDALVAEGILERFQGKGTFVRRPKFNASLFRFFRFQAPNGEKRVPESRILKRRVAPMPAEVSSVLKLPAGAPGIHLARLRLIDEVPLMVESIWVSRVRFAALLKLDPREFGNLLYPLYEQYCGQIVASAQETLTAETASPQHARSLGIPAGSPVIVIERLALSFDQQPLEWRHSRGRADQFRYQVEIR
jgi:GntR family transcriptional regulator